MKNNKYLFKISTFLLIICGLLVSTQSCISPVDVKDPFDKTNIDSPFVAAPLFEPKVVVMNLEHETSLAPREDNLRPIWPNDVSVRIMIDTNNRKTRLLFGFSATVKPNATIQPRVEQPFQLKEIKISYPDTIDIADDEEYVIDKFNATSSNYFIYQYKQNNDFTAFVNEDAKITLKFIKVENRNRILVKYNYKIYIPKNGNNVPAPVRQFGNGELLISY